MTDFGESERDLTVSEIPVTESGERERERERSTVSEILVRERAVTESGERERDIGEREGDFALGIQAGCVFTVHNPPETSPVQAGPTMAEEAQVQVELVLPTLETLLEDTLNMPSDTGDRWYVLCLEVLEEPSSSRRSPACHGGAQPYRVRWGMAFGEYGLGGEDFARVRAGRQVSRPEPESAGLLPQLNDLLIYGPGSTIRSALTLQEWLGDPRGLRDSVFDSSRTFALMKFLGLAYQLIDDVLDFTGTTASLGKPSLLDIRHALEYLGKSNKIQRARELASQNAKLAAVAIESLPESDDEDVQRSRRALVDITHRIKLVEVEKFSIQENLNCARELAASHGIYGEKHKQKDVYYETNAASTKEALLGFLKTLVGNYIPISPVRDDVAAAYKKGMEWKASKMLLPYKQLCSEKR
ncbi:hypothetical protein Syun_020446 [Stephania yunnanensis]|uniref:Uncharacterized protein n=1 Tax=Stephania yunnanensis TaxID=152371 RepID=A0AAP0NPN5_9MAGN